MFWRAGHACANVLEHIESLVQTASRKLRTRHDTFRYAWALTCTYTHPGTDLDTDTYAHAGHTHTHSLTPKELFQVQCINVACCFPAKLEGFHLINSRLSCPRSFRAAYSPMFDQVHSAEYEYFRVINPVCWFSRETIRKTTMLGSPRKDTPTSSDHEATRGRMVSVRAITRFPDHSKKIRL